MSTQPAHTLHWLLLLSAPSCNILAYSKGPKIFYFKSFFVLSLLDLVLQVCRCLLGRSSIRLLFCIVPLHLTALELGDKSPPLDSSMLFRDFLQNLCLISGKPIYKVIQKGQQSKTTDYSRWGLLLLILSSFGFDLTL